MTLRLVLLSALLAACGGGGSSTGSPDAAGGAGTGKVACTYPPGSRGTGTQCAQYHNATATQEPAINSSCAQQSGTSGTTCSTTNLLGCCFMSAGGFEVGTCSYTDTGMTAAQEMSGCAAAGGTWMTSP